MEVLGWAAVGVKTFVSVRRSSGVSRGLRTEDRSLYSTNIVQSSGTMTVYWQRGFCLDP